MSELIIYLLKANVALIIFYLAYIMWLRKLTFYKLNRYYLLFSLIFSSVYPLINLSAWFAPALEIPGGILTVVPDWPQLQMAEEGMGMNGILGILFWIGVSVFGVLLLIKLTGVWRIHLKSVPSSWKIYPYRKTQEKTAPFSFWKNIYLNPILHSEDQYDQIFKHEQVHVSQLHSLDILIAETALLLFWYNPICWLTGQAVKENIEFITDQKVLSSGIDKKSYQFSLLNIAISSTQPVLGNHFNIKNLKKRIIMMNKKQTSKMRLGTYVLIVPAVVFGSLIFGVSQAYESREILKIVTAITPDISSDTLKKKPAIEKIEIEIEKEESINPVIKEVEKTVIILNDTVPAVGNPLVIVDGKNLPYELINTLAPDRIESINVLKGKNATSMHGEAGKNGVIEIVTKIDNHVSVDILEDINKHTLEGFSGEIDPNTLILLNGKKISQNELYRLAPEHIKEISVFKGEKAEEHFGEKGKNGVIQITTK